MTGTVTVNAPVRYRTWNAPSFATIDTGPGRREDGFRQGPTTHVAELPAEVLHALASAWLADLYGKARKPAPSLPSPGDHHES
jgi:hypothetical protein